MPISGYCSLFVSGACDHRVRAGAVPALSERRALLLTTLPLMPPGCRQCPPRNVLSVPRRAPWAPQHVPLRPSVLPSAAASLSRGPLIQAVASLPRVSPRGHRERGQSGSPLPTDGCPLWLTTLFEVLFGSFRWEERLSRVPQAPGCVLTSGGDRRPWTLWNSSSTSAMALWARLQASRYRAVLCSSSSSLRAHNLHETGSGVTTKCRRVSHQR